MGGRTVTMASTRKNVSMFTVDVSSLDGFTHI